MKDHQTPREPEDSYHFDGPVEALQEISASQERRLIGAVNDHPATVFWRRWLAWWGAT